MKTIFSKLTACIATLSIGTMLMFSCSQHDEPQYQTPSISGEEYFKGVYFLEGKVADKIDMFSTMKQKYVLDNDPDVREETLKLSAEIMDIIRNENATFFTTFAADMESNDHLRIGKSLRNGSELIKKSIVNLFQNNKEYREALEISKQIDMSKAIGQDGLIDQQKLEKLYAEFLVASNTPALGSRKTCIAVNIVFNVNVLINFNVGANVNLHLNINVVRNINIYTDEILPQRGSQNFADTPGLRNEMVIQQIVEAF
jgi:SdpC family antimicrobial peptide